VDVDVKSFDFAKLDASLKFLSDNTVTIQGMRDEKYFWSNADREAYKKTLFRKSPSKLTYPGEFLAVSDDKNGFSLCKYIPIPIDNGYLIQWLSEIEEGRLTSAMGRTYKISDSFMCIPRASMIKCVGMYTIDDCTYELPQIEWQSIRDTISTKKEHIYNKRKNVSDETEPIKKLKFSN
jgi:hypothetical protein